jgi:hypothetical protein
MTRAHVLASVPRSYDLTAAETAAGVTPVNYAYPPGHVLRYGNNTTPGTTDMSAAIQAAFDVMVEDGTPVRFDPSTYYVNTALTIDATGSYTYLIEGYGAKITSGTGITGYVITATGNRSPHQRVMRGITFDHQNNVSASGCVNLLTTVNWKFKDVSVVLYNTKSGYAAFRVGPTTPGVNNNCYWTDFEGCGFRPYSGGDGTDPDYCILLVGAANATTIRNCTFSTGTKAIGIVTDGVEYFISNGVLIQGNWFEMGPGSTAVDVVTLPSGDGGYWPAGLRIVQNRVENMDTFVSFTTTDGNTANQAAHIPELRMNYIIANVTTYVNNPDGAFLQLQDSVGFSPAYDQTEYHYGTKQFLLEENLRITNQSGNSSYLNGHLVLGAYHIWVEAATGKLRLKNSAPTSDSDGTVVGTQS